MNQKLVEAYLKKISIKLSIKEIKRTVFMGLFSYSLTFKDKSKLKVDFNYYPFPRIEKGLKFGTLSIDSLRDIAANKVHTLFVKPRDRDYIDLYFIMKNGKFELSKLILDAKAKFDWDIDKLTLASQFLRVKEINVLVTPKLFVPFDKKQMDDFFENEADKLRKGIFEA